MHRAGEKPGGYFASPEEEAQFLRRVLWSERQPAIAATVRALPDSDLETAIAAVVALLQDFDDPNSVQTAAGLRWRGHRGALAIAGLWLVSESRARCGPRHVEAKAAIVTLQYGATPASWPTPEWLTADADLLALLR